MALPLHSQGIFNLKIPWLFLFSKEEMDYDKEKSIIPAAQKNGIKKGAEVGTIMGYVTPEQIAQAKELDLLTYLQRFAPQELVHVGGSTWCTRAHDSLKISNGKWHWFSRGIGGRSALDYLVKVCGMPFTEAVETLAGRAAVMPPVSHAPAPAAPRVLDMPALNTNANAVKRYLAGRGIHPDIVEHCVKHKLLFETKQYHNALFAGYDEAGQIRYAALRGTRGAFKGEVSGSDKRYAFRIAPNQNAESVHVFESAIDLLSYATLCQEVGTPWRQCALLSLGGVSKEAAILPSPLERFLSEHPKIETVQLHLDNDETGRSAAANIMDALQNKYTVLNKPPRYGKDVNELLQIQHSRAKRERGTER